MSSAPLRFVTDFHGPEHDESVQTRTDRERQELRHLLDAPERERAALPCPFGHGDGGRSVGVLQPCDQSAAQRAVEMWIGAR